MTEPTTVSGSGPTDTATTATALAIACNAADGTAYRRGVQATIVRPQQRRKLTNAHGAEEAEPIAQPQLSSQAFESVPLLVVTVAFRIGLRANTFRAKKLGQNTYHLVNALMGSAQSTRCPSNRRARRAAGFDVDARWQ